MEISFCRRKSRASITAIQMDLKNDGLTMEIIKNTLDITYDAPVSYTHLDVYKRQI